MSRLAITLLGSPQVELDGVPLDITIRKSIAVLAYLAVTGVPHTRDALAAMFWPEADQAHARGGLRYALVQLKAALGEGWLQVTREQIGLPRHPNLVVDVAQIEALLAQVHAHSHPAQQMCADCASLLAQIVRLYGGPLLAGLSLSDSPDFDDWQFFESERLQRLVSDVLVTLVAYHRTTGTDVAALPYAQRWLALDPLNETRNQVLIQLYIDTDQQTAARRQYATFAKRLHDELHATPDAATTALLDQLGSAERQKASPTPASIPAQPSHAQPNKRAASPLPISTTLLLGRAHELDAIGTLLDDPTCRLLTLLGPGGSGKTRLALAVAEARQTHSVTAVFVPLAGLATSHALVATIAAAVGCPLHSGVDAQQRLFAFLRERPYLLVLDNLEHLLGAGDDEPDSVVTLLDAVLQTVHGVQILATSRVRLQLYEEQVYTVRGLEYPEWDTVFDADSYGAVQLFTQRARRVRHDFALTADSSPKVIQIVRLLAGQPLAIELAATWVATLTLDTIATELRTSIDLLESQARNVPMRHRSMRATYTLSWQQLTPQEQAVQQALTVFRGGFVHAAAVEVAKATSPLLQQLIDHSLLTSTRRVDGGMRYDIHEHLRQFAAEQLARDSARAAHVHACHADYYLNWIATQSAALTGSQRGTTLVTIEIEGENIQAAWAWAVEHQNLPLIEQSIAGICAFYHLRGRVPEGKAVCDYLITRFDNGQSDAATTHILGQALAWQGVFAIELLQVQVAHRLLEHSLTLLTRPHDDHLRAFVSYSLGRVTFLEGALAEAKKWLEHSLVLYHTYDDQIGIAQTLSMLGRLDWLMGDYAQSSRWYEDSLAIYRALNNVIESVHILSDLAMVKALNGQRDEVPQVLEQAEALAQMLDDQVEIAQAQRYLGSGMLHVGWNAAAQAHYEACLTIAATTKVYIYTVDDRMMLGFIYLMQQEYDQLTTLMHDTVELARTLGTQHNVGLALTYLGYAAFGKGAYGQARGLFQQCVSVYQRTSTADAQNLTLLGLSLVHRALGEQEQAREVAITALQVAAGIRSARAGGWALATCLGLLLDEQEIERAIELEALLMKHPVGANSSFYADILTKPLDNHKAHLPPHVVAAAQARGRAGDVLATVDALLAENTMVSRPVRSLEKICDR